MPRRSSGVKREKKHENIAEKTHKKGQATVNGKKKTENPAKPCDLDPRLAPRLPDVCEKNVFRLIRSSASGKQHFLRPSSDAELFMSRT